MSTSPSTRPLDLLERSNAPQRPAAGPAARHQVHLWAGRAAGRPATRPDAHELYRVGEEWARAAAMTVAALEPSATPGPAVLHVHCRTPGDLPGAAALALPDHDALVVHLHGARVPRLHDTRRHAGFPGARATRLLRDADLVVAMSAALEAFAHGLRVGRVCRPAPAPLPLPHGLGLESPRPAPWVWGRRLVAVGALDVDGRPEALVTALAHQPRDVNLVLLGDGPGRDELRGAAARHGVGHRVHLAAAPTRGEVEAHLAHADVVLADGHHGTFALLRAMQLARCVVADDGPGTRRLISSGSDGLLVAPGDGQGLAATIRELLEQRPFAEALGAAAARRVAGRDWSDVAAEILADLDAPTSADPGDTISADPGDTTSADPGDDPISAAAAAGPPRLRA